MISMLGAKILITGPTGQVATPIARALAADNEVWGIARFTDVAVRESLEKPGIRGETINLATGAFTGLPSDSDYARPPQRPVRLQRRVAVLPHGDEAGRNPDPGPARRTGPLQPHPRGRHHRDRAQAARSRVGPGDHGQLGR